MANIKRISGINTIIKNMTGAKNKIAAGVGRGLKKGALHLGRATDKYIPVQLGPLKASRSIRNVGGSGFKTDMVVSFGSEGVDYAIVVHEDMELRHGKRFNEHYAAEIAAAIGTARGTKEGGMFERGPDEQAKFLERPAREEKRRIIKIIQREARI